MIYWKNFLHLPTIWRFKIKPRPQFFYKYHPINKYAIELLENHSLWGGNALALNDPYDCEFDLTEEFINTKYLNDLLLEEQFKKVPSEHLNIARTFLSTDEGVQKELVKVYKSAMNVCCFTANPLSELMWSHYADSAKGVCFKFGFHKSSEILRRIMPIKYSNKRIIAKNEFDRAKAFFQKRTSWRYEKEWRVLYDNENIPFEKSELVEIIFGPRTSEAEIENMKEICKKNDYNVKFSSCVYDKKGLVII